MKEKYKLLRAFLAKKLGFVKIAFQTLLIVYLALLLINEFSRLKLINMTTFLIIVIVLGVISILLPEEERKKKPKPKTVYDYALAYVIGIIAGVLVFLKTREMGWLSYVIAVITFLLVILLADIIYSDEKAEKK